MMEVRRIGAEATIPLRWPVLRAGLPRESAVFPGDEWETTHHLGAYAGEGLCGVVTIYPAPLPERPDLSVALGAYEVSLLELSSGFQVFQLGGKRVAPSVIDSIDTKGGQNPRYSLPRNGSDAPLAALR